MDSEVHDMIMPKIGNYYWHYDDGKVRPSRQEIVKIVGVCKYSELSEELRDIIDNEIKENDWLYDNVITYVLFGKNLSMTGGSWKPGDEEIIYLPSNNGWYGFGKQQYWNEGVIDINGDLTEKYINQREEYDEIYPSFPSKKDIAKVEERMARYGCK